MCWPVVCPDLSDCKKTVVVAISSTVVRRLRGGIFDCTDCSFCSGSGKLSIHARYCSVMTSAGMTVFRERSQWLFRRPSFPCTSRSGISVSTERKGISLPPTTLGVPRRPVLQFQFRSALSAYESTYPSIFARYENIDRFSWRRFFRVTDLDSYLLDSKQLKCGNVLRFSCAFRL